MNDSDYPGDGPLDPIVPLLDSYLETRKKLRNGEPIDRDGCSDLDALVEALLKERENVLRDHTTKLPNKQAFQERVTEAVADAWRSKTPYTLFIADIDHFKRFNTEHGYAFGDEVLKQVAGALRGAIRPYDFLARWGGEEFAGYLVRQGPGAETFERLNAIRERVVDRTKSYFEHTGRDVDPVTISIGAAPLRKAAGHQAFARANQALQEAKDAGRNRVIMYRE